MTWDRVVLVQVIYLAMSISIPVKTIPEEEITPCHRCHSHRRVIVSREEKLVGPRPSTGQRNRNRLVLRSIGERPGAVEHELHSAVFPKGAEGTLRE